MALTQMPYLADTHSFRTRHRHTITVTRVSGFVDDAHHRHLRRTTTSNAPRPTPSRPRRHSHELLSGL